LEAISIESNAHIEGENSCVVNVSKKYCACKILVNGHIFLGAKAEI
jgi:hypothetical protein